MPPSPRDPGDLEVNLTVISMEEVWDYIECLNVRERGNHRRIQAWFDHCARIRSNPCSMISRVIGGRHR